MSFATWLSLASWIFWETFFFSNKVNSDSKRDNQRLLNKDGLGWKELKWIDNEDEEI